MNSTKSLASSWSLILASQMSGQQSANQHRSGPCLQGGVGCATSCGEIRYLLQTFRLQLLPLLWLSEHLVLTMEWVRHSRVSLP